MARIKQLLTLAQERARKLGLPYQGALTPPEAHELLGLIPSAKLVDVRTRAEWEWVGRVPDAVEIEWLSWPGSQPNPHFLAELKRTLPSDSVLFFICRSGARSNAAAKAASEAGYAECYNVLEGFEGDKDANHHRNASNGWRFHGLPWIQG
ncbi:MAG TPA: rhodanese-like domain-containing protein [Rhodocyclaceae bacterium]